MSIGQSFANVLDRSSSSVATLTDGTAPTAAPMMSEAERKARFARFVREHHTFVWRCARRLGVPPADVDDVVQEVLLLAERKLDVIERERGYLFQTCVYVVGHARRRRKRRREIIDDERVNAEIDVRATPERSAENAQAREQLQIILDAMPDDLRAAFILFELERFTMSEIAEISGAPMGTVASRLRRAREIFLSRVEAFGRGER